MSISSSNSTSDTLFSAANKLKTVQKTKSKKKGKINASSLNEEKRLPFFRLWFEIDETELLKGILDYSTGDNPADDLHRLYAHIRTFIKLDVTDEQLKNKIRRMRLKYEKKLGKTPTFKSAHDSICFQLSHKIWGSSIQKEEGRGEHIIGTEGGVDIDMSTKSSSVCFTEVFKLEGFHGMTLNRDLMRKGLDLLGDDVLQNLTTKWNKLVREETRLHCQRLELVLAQTKLVLEAYNSA